MRLMLSWQMLRGPESAEWVHNQDPGPVHGRRRGGELLPPPKKSKFLTLGLLSLHPGQCCNNRIIHCWLTDNNLMANTMLYFLR